jgi:type II secretory pathway predicted ATPase ExeA
MLTNHDMDSSTPFATILVDQPTLRHSVKLGVLAAWSSGSLSDTR